MELDDKINLIRGRLKEFVNQETLDILEEQAGKKDVYAFVRTDLKRENRKLFYKVILLSELGIFYSACRADNLGRSKNDEVISSEFPLPKTGRFFRKDLKTGNIYETPIYGIEKKEDAQLREEAVAALDNYISSFNFWKEELSEAA